MSRMTGGRAVVESLRAEGADHVFGLIGSAAMEVFDALHDAKDIRLIAVRDERTGTHMADGFARASGNAGVVLAGQNGPGATNLVTGLAQAKAAYSPVVALAGSLSSAHAYRDAFQEVDQKALFDPVTKKTWTLTQAARIPEMMREAFRVATTPRKGPVALNLPRDMLAETMDEVDIPGPRGRGVTALACADIRSIDAAVALLASARQPLIIAGGGVKNGRASAMCTALGEALGAPIAMSPGHGDAVSCEHPLYAGQVGPRGNPVASDLAKRADVIIALGTRLGFNTTFYNYDNLNRAAKIIQIDAEPTALGRFFPVTQALAGDAGEIAGQIRRGLAGMPLQNDPGWLTEFQAKRRAFLEDRDRQATPSDPLQPAALYKALRTVLPRDAMFTLDAGTLCLQATDQMRYVQPPALFTPLDFGLVGFSYACGLGVKLACPDRTVVSLMGDGGFGMTASELGTAVSHGIDTICVVMNNGCWGAEKAYQRDFFGERYIGADIPNPPYDKLAELWGAAGFRVERARDLEPTLSAALECGRPAVVDVRVDPQALFSFRRDSFTHRAKG